MIATQTVILQYDLGFGIAFSMDQTEQMKFFNFEKQHTHDLIMYQVNSQSEYFSVFKIESEAVCPSEQN